MIAWRTRAAMLVCVAGMWLPATVLADPLDSLYRLQDARTRRVSSADPNWRDGNGDCRPIPPGGTLTVADIKGRGIIRHIWFTIAADDPQYGRSIVLRMYWDGSEEPAVESPIGDFFAVGHGALRYVNSLPVAVTSDGKAMNCYWPMPFKDGAKITLTNDSKKHNVGCVFWYVDYEERESLPQDHALFHAQYRQEYPAKMGQDYLILDAVGRGHYVGTVYSAQIRTFSWFGEGDDRFFIDGEEEPSLRGTGTEDYFCDAWGFRLFDRPFYGVTLLDGYEVGDRLTVYRWHVSDPVHFRKSLKVTIEHKGVMSDTDGKVVSGFAERPDLLSSVAFWYQTGTAKRFATLPPVEERIVPVTAIELEDLEKGFQTGPAEAGRIVQNGGYSAGKQVLITFPATPATLRVPFTLKEKVAGLVRIKLTRSFDYGIWKVSLDGKPLPGMERLDLYSPTVQPSEFKVGFRELDAGPHELTFECLGKNDASKGYYLGVDAILVEAISPYSVPAKKDAK